MALISLQQMYDVWQNMLIKISGIKDRLDSQPEIRGLFSARPSANSVVVGTVYWAIDKDDENEITVSDGSNWREV